MRINSKGKSIPSNYGITRLSESSYECNGCNRKFSAFDTKRPGGFALSTDASKLYARNKARAMRHADTCKGPQ